MEITISDECPHCGKRIQLKGTINNGLIDDQAQFMNTSYELARDSSINALKKKSCLDGVYSLEKKEEKDLKAISAGIITLQTYFNDIFFDVKSATTIKDLVKIKQSLENVNLGVSKDLAKAFEDNKKRLTVILDKRLKELGKSEKKRKK